MENLEQIERYLDQQMSADEREVFENQLATTPGLQQQVKEIRAARAAIDLLYTDSIRQRLQGYEADYVKKQARRRRYTGWAIAAVALLLLVGYLLWPSSSPTRDDLYQKYLANVCEETKKLDNTRGQDLPTPALRPVEQDMLTLCQEIEAQDTALLRANLTGWEEKIAQNKEVAAELTFYLGLAYWKLGEYEKADASFRWVVENRGQYHAKASALLSELARVGI